MSSKKLTDDEFKERFDKTYTRIPESIERDSDLDGDVKVIYGRILNLSHQRGYCSMTRKDFANWYGVSVITITRWLRKLRERNYIRVEKHRVRSVWQPRIFPLVKIKSYRRN